MRFSAIAAGAVFVNGGELIIDGDTSFANNAAREGGENRCEAEHEHLGLVRWLTAEV